MTSPEKPFLRVRVSRGATVPTGSDRWEKGEWAIESDAPEGMDADQAIRDLQNILLRFVTAFTTPHPSDSSLPASQTQTSGEPTPELSPAYLDHLPWNVETWGAWIMRSTPEAKALSKALETGLKTIGGYRYKVSRGESAEFINRFPVEAGKK